MYDRTVNGKVLKFRVSGKLWNRSLVMSDVETDTLWSHLLGKAMQGELMGTQLKTIPSVITSWADWKSLHPDTTVMIMEQFQGKHYNTDYLKQDSKNKLAIGYVDGNAAKCYTYKALNKQSLVNDIVNDLPILISFDIETGAAWCFERSTAGKVLTFEEKEGEFRDRETESNWNLKTGEATAGEMKGTRLVQRNAIPTFEHSWKTFYPESEFFEAQ